MKTDSEITRTWHGIIVTATVERISQYYVNLSSDKLPITSRLNLHISQASFDYLDSLVGKYQIGEQVDVVVLYYSAEPNCWEVSRVAVIGPEILTRIAPPGTQRWSGFLGQICGDRKVD